MGIIKFNPWTFSPYLILDEMNVSKHKWLKMARMEVEFLNVLNAVNGKSTLTNKSREDIFRRSPYLAQKMIPLIDNPSRVEVSSPWRDLLSSFVAHNPNKQLGFENALNYLGECDEFTTMLIENHESLGKSICEKKVCEFLGFSNVSELNYPVKTKLDDLILIETAIKALAKYDIGLSTLHQNCETYKCTSYFSKLLNPSNTPIKQWWLNLRDKLNLNNYHELANKLQNNYKTINNDDNGYTIFEHTKIRKWANGSQRMKWDVAVLLEKLLAPEALHYASCELQAVSRIFHFLESFLAKSSELDVKQHGSQIRTVLLNRFESRWTSEVSS